MSDCGGGDIQRNAAAVIFFFTNKYAIDVKCKQISDAGFGDRLVGAIVVFTYDV